MAMISSNKLLAALDESSLEPVAGQRAVLEVMEQMVNGDELLVDASNPFALLMGIAVTGPVNAINKSQILSRRQYALLAMTPEDLYPVMSDRDMLSSWWQPSTAEEIMIHFSLDEIKKFAVPTGAGNVRKLTIPQNAQFSVGGMAFTLEYPVEIRIMSHGGPSVSFGNVTYAPAIPIDSNIVNWGVAGDKNVDYLWLSLKVPQFRIQNNLAHLNSAQVYNGSFSFTENFFFARVFTRADGSDWKEIKTTYTDLQFDPGRPTALLQVAGQRLYVKIPQIYYTYGLMKGEIKVSIYTTQGLNNKFLGEYYDTDWSYRWNDVEKDDLDKYSAALNALSTIQIFSDSTLSGARAPLTFAELRKRVLENNAGDIKIPITNANLTVELADMGYGAVIDTDDLASRVIWATRELPLGDEDQKIKAGTVAPPSTLVSSLITTMDELVVLPHVTDNGQRITLHPEMLYKLDSGAVRIVTQGEIDQLNSLLVDGLARAVSSGGFLYTPFHYVFDATNNQFGVRAYYLDAPKVVTRRYRMENDTLALELNTANAVTISRTAKGYKINLIARSGESYRNLEDSQLQVQLAFVPVGETARAYMNGTMVGRTAEGEFVWEFELVSNFDLDSSNALHFTNFQMFSGVPRAHGAPLDCTFDLIYTVSNYKVRGMETSDIDNLKNANMLPHDAIGVLYEQVSIKLGDALKYLWTGSRAIPTPMDYETYAADTPLIRLVDEYAREVLPGGGQGPIIFDIVEGKQTPRVIGARGTVVMQADGVTPVLKGEKGDWILDDDGNMIPKGPRALARQVDMFFIDGRYFFANDPDMVTYKQFIVGTMRDRVVEELGSLNKNVLEETSIYYRPQNTLSDVRVIVEEGREIFLNAEQYIKITIMLEREDYLNDKLRDGLRTTAGQVLAGALNEGYISTDMVQTRLREQSGVGTLGIRMVGLGGTKDYLTVTNKDNSGKLSIRKKVTVMADGLLTIEDDIDVDFKRHLPSTSDL